VGVTGVAEQAQQLAKPAASSLIRRFAMSCPSAATRATL
jgi:hypothetical protein